MIKYIYIYIYIYIYKFKENKKKSNELVHSLFINKTGENFQSVLLGKSTLSVLFFTHQ